MLGEEEEMVCWLILVLPGPTANSVEMHLSPALSLIWQPYDRCQEKRHHYSMLWVFVAH